MSLTTRRCFLLSPAAIAAGGLLPAVLRAQTAPAVVTRDSARPMLLSGLQSGDVLADRAIVWVRTSRAARMWLEWSTTVFLHCGDTIYADGPIPAELKLRDGSLWKNTVTPEVSKVDQAQEA